MKLLTPKEGIVLSVIKRFFSKYGHMPTFSEIQQETEKLGLPIKSKGGISVYLKSLEEKQYIKKSPVKRGIVLLDTFSDRFLSIPILGAASAGSPTMFAEEYVQGHLKVSKSLIGNKENVFAIQVHGTSMNLSEVNRKKVEDGDFIIVDGGHKDYRDKDKLLVVIDGLATVKMYKRIDEQTIGLYPESTDAIHHPFFITLEDGAIINGKVIDVFKSNKEED